MIADFLLNVFAMSLNLPNFTALELSSISEYQRAARALGEFATDSPQNEWANDYHDKEVLAGVNFVKPASTCPCLCIQIAYRLGIRERWVNRPELGGRGWGGSFLWDIIRPGKSTMAVYGSDADNANKIQMGDMVCIANVDGSNAHIAIALAAPLIKPNESLSLQVAQYGQQSPKPPGTPDGNQKTWVFNWEKRLGYTGWFANRMLYRVRSLELTLNNASNLETPYIPECLVGEILNDETTTTNPDVSR